MAHYHFSENMRDCLSSWRVFSLKCYVSPCYSDDFLDLLVFLISSYFHIHFSFTFYYFSCWLPGMTSDNCETTVFWFFFKQQKVAALTTQAVLWLLYRSWLLNLYKKTSVEKKALCCDHKRLTPKADIYCRYFSQLKNVLSGEYTHWMVLVILCISRAKLANAGLYIFQWGGQTGAYNKRRWVGRFGMNAKYATVWK